MVGKLTIKNLVAHKVRLALALVAVVLGTSFVSASFIVSDGLNNTFNGLFTEISKGIDAQVRTKAVFGDQGQAQRDPVAAALLDTIRKVDGVDVASGTLFRSAPMLDKAGKPIKTQGAPTGAIDFGGETVLSGTRLLSGTAPKGDTQAVIDGATADRNKFKVGDQVTAVLDSGTRKLVHVMKAEGMYEAKEVKLGLRAGSFYPVLDGLKEGDLVVVRGNFLLDSQFQIAGLPSLFYPEGQAPSADHSGHGGKAAQKPDTPSAPPKPAEHKH